MMSMISGSVVVMALEREDAIAKWREVMGATNPANAPMARSESCSRNRLNATPRTVRCSGNGGG